MPIKPIFSGFEPLITGGFAAAKQDAGLPASDVRLELHEEPYNIKGRRAEFLVLGSKGPVRITWNGIASLWAVAQAAARICRICHEGRRNRTRRVDLDDEPELRRGMDTLIMAKRLLDNDIPQEGADPALWPGWAAEVDPTAIADSDTGRGNRFFLGALGWILRHELAHITLLHGEREKVEGLRSILCEREADEQATAWLRGNRKADRGRTLGAKPEEAELELEMRAVAVAIGLIWVALFEADAYGRGDSHPPVADRLDKCFAALALREDSFAKEVLADLIRIWTDPQGSPVDVNNSDEAFQDAMVRLHRILSDSSDGPWTSKVW